MKQDYWNQLLREAARKDAFYQELLAQCREAEKGYVGLLERLSSDDREMLERYISLCEALEHRMTQLSWDIPRNDGENPAN